MFLPLGRVRDDIEGDGYIAILILVLPRFPDH